MAGSLTMKFYLRKSVFEQNLAKPQNTYPSKILGYTVQYKCCSTIEQLLTYISIELQEHLVVVVVSESGVSRQALQKILMHGYRFLEGGQILPI